ncbi:MAG TPA: hypothetical protein VHM89_06775, partial [Acidimicrobiales bacterium]|nr:hypothetical protein [Acidimicrobiales bacterium]
RFEPGVTSLTVAVPVLADTVAEGDETFTVTLSTASGATITDGSGSGRVIDDDYPNATNPPAGRSI